MRVHLLSATVWLLVLVMPALAYDDYVGYSNAPGSLGSCAYSCHGPMGGTIWVQGFPSSYQPGATYTIRVGHSGGSTISNFNASVRVGSGSVTAGVITAGLNTATYSVTAEPNGVHLRLPDRDSGIFYWQAPNPAVGPVTFYLAGEQGTTRNGPNTEIVLMAAPMAAVEEASEAKPLLAFEVSPTMVSSSTTIQATLPQGKGGSLLVLDANGRVVTRLELPATAGGRIAVGWRPYRADGSRLASGPYFVLLESGSHRVLSRVTVR